MYERMGMGFSDLSFWEKLDLWLSCESYRHEGKPKEMCFQATEADENIAQSTGCTRLVDPIAHSLSPQPPCGDNGKVWCCPEGYPRDYMQDVPSDVSIYDEARRRLLAQEPEGQTPGAPRPGAPPGRDPAPVHQRTFIQKLQHPGAIAAMVAIAGGAGLFYALKRRRAGR